jgi:hypothetical protein
VWLFDLLPQKYKSVCNGVMNGWDTSVLTFVTLYYLFINKDWFYITLFFSVLGAFAKIFILIIAPESPRWLLM